MYTEPTPQRPLHDLSRRPLTPPPSPQFEAPHSAPAPDPAPAPRPIRHGLPFLLATGPVAGALVAVVVRLAGAEADAAQQLPFVAGLVVGVAALVLAVGNGVRALARAPERTVGQTAGAIGLSLLSAFATLIAMSVSSMMVMGAGRGRQLRRLGRPLHAEVQEGSPWLVDARAASLAAPQHPDLALQQVADAWRTNGQTEHASVAAFAELSLELVALGAPPRLIAAAHHDALDEMRHTEQCFSLAQALDGRPRGPRDFSAAGRLMPRLGPRALRLAHLAVTSLYDGALYEGLSARVVAELARTDVDARVRPVLEAIARDEARHAAHGFEIVRWCLDEGGAPVARALAVALDRLRDAQPHALIPDPRAADGRWERFGIPGRARELAGWAIVRARVVARTERLLGQGGITVA